MTCVGVPVSWPRLERFASGSIDGAAAREIEAHVVACEACRACLDDLRADVVALLPLPVLPVRTPSRFARWLFAGGGLALAAAAVLLLVVFRGGAGSSSHAPGARVAVKGAGEVVLSLVRDRDGAIAYDPTTFRATDRIKVRVTCDPGPAIWAQVVVYQRNTVSMPIAATRLDCGNQVVVPGAFRIVDGGDARVCVSLSTGARAGDPFADLACIELAPE